MPVHYSHIHPSHNVSSPLEETQTPTKIHLAVPKTQLVAVFAIGGIRLASGRVAAAAVARGAGLQWRIKFLLSTSGNGGLTSRQALRPALHFWQGVCFLSPAETMAMRPMMARIPENFMMIGVVERVCCRKSWIVGILRWKVWGWWSCVSVGGWGSSGGMESSAFVLRERGWSVCAGAFALERS